MFDRDSEAASEFRAWSNRDQGRAASDVFRVGIAIHARIMRRQEALWSAPIQGSANLGNDSSAALGVAVTTSFFDDVRHEASGKVTLVGGYSGLLIRFCEQAVPEALRLYAVTTLLVPPGWRAPKAVPVRVRLGDSVLSEQAVDRAHIREAMKRVSQALECLSGPKVAVVPAFISILRCTIPDEAEGLLLVAEADVGGGWRQTGTLGVVRGRIADQSDTAAAASSLGGKGVRTLH